MLFFWIILFFASLFTLVKASSFFVDSAEKIGMYFGASSFVIGITIIAMGTSLPELVSSIIAVFKKSSEIVAGNIVGANIANILLISGIAAVMSKKAVELDSNFSKIDLPIFLGSAFVFAASAANGLFSWSEALVCLFIFTSYMIFIIKSNRKKRVEGMKEELKEEKQEGLNQATVLIFILSGIFIYFGAMYTVESVIGISKALKISKELIAISAVSLGTTLPEMMVTISAMKKGDSNMAVGNILGSNIFNVLCVAGVPALFGSIIIPKSIIYFGLPSMLGATLLYFFIVRDKKITRQEGWLFLALYALFIGKLFWK